MLTIIFKNLKKPNRKTAFVLNWADYLFTASGQLPPDERDLLTLLSEIGEKHTRLLLCVSGGGSLALLDDLLSEKPAFRISDLAVGGRDLFPLGFSGPRLGSALSRLLIAVMDGEVENEREALLAFILGNGDPSGNGVT